jgi:hypothetical protein
MLTTRYCRRCVAPTEHVADDQPWPPWYQVLFWPLMWLFPPLVSLPRCLACLERYEAGHAKSDARPTPRRGQAHADRRRAGGG